MGIENRFFSLDDGRGVVCGAWPCCADSNDTGETLYDVIEAHLCPKFGFVSLFILFWIFYVLFFFLLLFSICS